ncbi:MAG: GHKL domain-containing protein [Saprospirales bacterium]|nr:GHKL domain-containing protein [Saprospirales bacterium]
MLLNILNNACYAVHQKQQAGPSEYTPTLTITTSRTNGEVSIHIRDNGPGMPPEVREKIFMPFFTTKPSGEGNTGLGLSISHDIVVDKHGGRLEVNSEPGEFTEFVITIPV